jgi:hypothetical protein
MSQTDSRARYREYLETPAWQRLRLHALGRDNYRCRICNATKNLEIHHRYYPKILGTETVDALTTLCRHHHDLVRRSVMGHGRSELSGFWWYVLFPATVIAALIMLRWL